MRRLGTAAALGLMCALAPAAAAQSIELAERSTPGWVFTPTIAIGVTFDDNPVLTVRGDASPDDVLTHVRPGLDVSLNARHTNLSGTYRGQLARYRTLEEYDSYGQGGQFQVRHQASRRVGLFGRHSFTVSPATDILEISGVPFYRAGTRHHSVQAGTTVALSRRLEASGSYQFQSVDFDAVDPAIDLLLLGGTAHGVTFGLKRRLSARVSVGASYQYQTASYGATEGGFGIQNGEATVDWQLRPTVEVSGAFGFSRLAIPGPEDARLGPAGRVQVRKRTSHALFTVGASRSFVPAFGFGGSVMNQEVTAGVNVPFARRRAFVRGSISWRDSEPVLEREVGLSSMWLQSAVGYSLRRWVRIEAFYSGTFQNTTVVGGQIERNRIGVQLSTGHPMRIQ